MDNQSKLQKLNQRLKNKKSKNKWLLNKTQIRSFILFLMTWDLRNVFKYVICILSCKNRDDERICSETRAESRTEGSRCGLWNWRRRLLHGREFRRRSRRNRPLH